MTLIRTASSRLALSASTAAPGETEGGERENEAIGRNRAGLADKESVMVTRFCVSLIHALKQ